MNTFHQHTGIISLPAIIPLAEIDEAAELSGMHPGMIEMFLIGHLVSAAKDPGGVPHFDPAGVCRLRQIQYFREHGRANLRTIRYIVNLLDALDEKERELGSLRELVR